MSQAVPALDFHDPAFLADPYPVYHRLRAAAPVFKAPFGRWFVTRYDDSALMLRDRRFGKDYATPEALMRRFGSTAMDEPAVVELSHMMLMRDPPDHTRLRGLVSKAFTARRVEELRLRVRDIAEGLVDRAIANCGMDAISDLAFPLPVMVICELLGIPPADRDHFAGGAAAGAALLNPTPPSRDVLDAANTASEESARYFHALFDLRRREPADDLITSLVQAEESGDRLSNAELVANVHLLFAAGHETTVNLIGNGLRALLLHLEQWRILSDDSSLIPNAIEEILRFDSPVQSVARTMAEPVELRGQTLEQGAIVVSLLGAANRDPEAFADPDRFDVTRPDVRSVSFGGGIHFCLGAQLARIEAAEVFGVLLRRLPDMRLVEPERAAWRESFILRGLTKLPVAW
jgi:cytochrome P450